MILAGYGGLTIHHQVNLERAAAVAAPAIGPRVIGAVAAPENPERVAAALVQEIGDPRVGLPMDGVALLRANLERVAAAAVDPGLRQAVAAAGAVPPPENRERVDLLAQAGALPHRGLLRGRVASLVGLALPHRGLLRPPQVRVASRRDPSRRDPRPRAAREDGAAAVALAGAAAVVLAGVVHQESLVSPVDQDLVIGRHTRASGRPMDGAALDPVSRARVEAVDLALVTLG